MERSIEIAVTHVLFERISKERESISEDYIIGVDRDYVDGCVVRQDVMYDEEALEGAAFENVREKVVSSTHILDIIRNDFACNEAMGGLIDRSLNDEVAEEELRNIILEVMDKKVGW